MRHFDLAAHACELLVRRIHTTCQEGLPIRLKRRKLIQSGFQGCDPVDVNPRKNHQDHVKDKLRRPRRGMRGRRMRFVRPLFLP